MADDYNDYEAIYAYSLGQFASVFDSDYMRDADYEDDELRIMERDVRETWASLRDTMTDDYEDMDAADIRSAIRDAARELRIPEHWTD